LFVTTTNNTVLEVDPVSFNVLSETDLKPFLPLPPPTGVQTVQAFEFNKAGDQVILGGNFGLVTVERAVPEPPTYLLAIIVLGGYIVYSRKKPVRCSV
jgi:hypothetical protein